MVAGWSLLGAVLLSKLCQGSVRAGATAATSHGLMGRRDGGVVLPQPGSLDGGEGVAEVMVRRGEGVVLPQRGSLEVASKVSQAPGDQQGGREGVWSGRKARDYSWEKAEEAGLTVPETCLDLLCPELVRWPGVRGCPRVSPPGHDLRARSGWPAGK